MRTYHGVKLELNPKTVSNSILKKALLALAAGEANAPSGVKILNAEKDGIVVRIDRAYFEIEQDAVVAFNFPHLKLTKLFLIPTSQVHQLELRVKADKLSVTAICTGQTPMTKLQAKKVRGARTLPPGIHNEAALFITEKVRPSTVSGGLPSLGKRR